MDTNCLQIKFYFSGGLYAEMWNQQLKNLEGEKLRDEKEEEEKRNSEKNGPTTTAAFHHHHHH